MSMRDYSKISPQFWIGQTGKEIRKLGAEAQVVAMYLLSAPGSTMIGVYYLPLQTISYETGIPIETVSRVLEKLLQVQAPSKPLRSAIEAPSEPHRRGKRDGFCSYDYDYEYIWVHEMAVYQIDATLKENDKRVKNVQKGFLSLPDLCFLDDFFEKYGEAFHLIPRNSGLSTSSPIEAPSEPHRSQEQKQDQKLKKNILKKNKLSTGKENKLKKTKVPNDFFVEPKTKEKLDGEGLFYDETTVLAFIANSKSKGKTSEDWQSEFEMFVIRKHGFKKTTPENTHRPTYN
jgi:hypothetical protein